MKRPRHAGVCSLAGNENCPMTNSFDIRLARTTDAEAICTIMAEIANQIPVNLSTPKHIEAMKRQITDCCLDGFSVVAVDESGVVIGFQLAQKKSWYDESYIHLLYAGVTGVAADKKVFRRLIEIEKAHCMPLVAEVKPGNLSGMANRLNRYGFRPDRNGPNNFGYRWDPR